MSYTSFCQRYAQFYRLMLHHCTSLTTPLSISLFYPLADDGNYAIMSASDGVVQVGEGVACPTDDLAFECSGHGTCDCVYGRCTCDDVSCIGGSGCSDLCKNGGKCDSASDACICPPNYDVASQ